MPRNAAIAALAKVVGNNHFLYHLLITVGLFGLIASFHGILLVAGRATFEFGRVGYLPSALGKTLPKRKTPAAALLVNMVVGFLALATGRTGDIITLAAFGALMLYMLSMLSLFKLRQVEPDLERPYLTPMYPVLPGLAFALAAFCFVAMMIYNLEVGIVFLAIFLGSWMLFRIMGQSEA